MGEPTPAPDHFLPISSRWFSPGHPIDGVAPPEYEEVNRAGDGLNPYTQNVLKGDFPIFGTEDLFLNTTVTNRAILQFRNVPTPVGITGTGPVNTNFFGDGKQFFFNDDLAVSFDLFKGQQAFKPVDWRLKVTPVFNVNYLEVQEVGVVDIDVSEGTTRTRTDFALQEAFAEIHLFDLSDRYDFLSIEAGILPFRSDFRGFMFDDVNLGVRVFGNYDNNLWQYNAAYFNTLDKNTNSLLNEFESRDQQVVILNLYRQDWPVRGYTTSFSFHHNNDDREFEFDDNGFLVAPAPAGQAQPNRVESYYLGWAGEGHLGRFNITHQFYQALGRESNNPFAAQGVDINAQFAAIELSYDIDWWRPRIFSLYASGDDDPRDGEGGGFDAIFDAPRFAGGDASFFTSQNIRLLGVGLTNQQSPLVDLQTSKFQGQANSVNPGVWITGAAVDVEVTPETRLEVGGNYLRFMDTGSLETFLQIPNVDKEIGYEVFALTQYRPTLTNNWIIQVGANAFFPGDGFANLYESDETLYSVFTTVLTTF